MKTYIIECIGNMYFNGFELHPVKAVKELENVELTVSQIKDNLRKLFPDFFSGILDYKVTVVEYKEEKEKRGNKLVVKTTSEVEILRDFDTFEHEFL
jgi:DNA polymerase sigma